MPEGSDHLIAHEHSSESSESLVTRIDAGEQVTDTERLAAIKNLLAFSSRDWSTDPELWAIYKAANHTKEDPVE